MRYQLNHNMLGKAFWLAICFMLPPPALAKIISTNNAQVIGSQINAADPSTLIIFDVQNVLLQPKDKMLKQQNRQYLNKFRKQLEAKCTHQKYQELYSLILLQRRTEPVDLKLVQFIREAQQREVKVLGLTNCRTGQFGKIAAMEQKRLQELNNAGYHFHHSWPSLKTQILTSEGRTCPPIFRQGVVFTCRTPKGPALQAFLTYAAFKPSRIIFIDDQIRNLRSVEELAKRLKIPFVGIEYLAPKTAPLSQKDFERANWQFHILEKERRWASDEEADLKMPQQETS